MKDRAGQPPGEHKAGCFLRSLGPADSSRVLDGEAGAEVQSFSSTRGCAFCLWDIRQMKTEGSLEVIGRVQTYSQEGLKELAIQGFPVTSHSGSTQCSGLLSQAPQPDPGLQGSFFFFNIYFPAPDLSCEMWDLVPRPGIELEHPGLRVQSLSQWATREVPARVFLPAWRISTWSTVMHAWQISTGLCQALFSLKLPLISTV